MAIIISSSSQKKQFDNNKVLTVGSKEQCDFYIHNTDFELVLEYNEKDNTYTVTNNGGICPLFKGKSFKTLIVSKITRLIFQGSQEFVNFEVVVSKNVSENQADAFFNEDIKPLYEGGGNSFAKIKLDKAKMALDAKRTSIIKEVSHQINDLKKKINQNAKGAIFSHFALFWGCFLCAFAVNNYICGLSIQESADYIHLPTDIKLWLLYTVLIMGIMFIFKQGMYGWFYSKTSGNQTKMSKSAQIFLISISLLLMSGVYCFNLVYYLNYTKSLVFPVLISAFFVGITLCLGASSGYYKSAGSELSELLNKYEYREDFEKVMQDYKIWVGHYINNLSSAKLSYISDKTFKLHIAEGFEIIIGMMTAPFLAYGVSITLANCFPEAAGWIRISGMRFSPVFLVLASCLIIFAFFLLVNGFAASRKISVSEIIKHDGFSNYLEHCSEILGLEGTNKAQKEKTFSFYTAVCIIAIEFTMNLSYFTTEIGLDFSGLFVSFVAALVPTALLVAETYMLGKTKFELYALDEIRAKADR